MSVLFLLAAAVARAAAAPPHSPPPAPTSIVKSGTFKIKGNDVPWVVDLPTNGMGYTMALVLAHGGKGNLSTGRLPLYAQAAAQVGVPVLRMTFQSRSVTARAQVMQALMANASHLVPDLKYVRHWVVGGHSLGARAAVRVAVSLNRGPKERGTGPAAYGFGGDDEAPAKLREEGHKVLGVLLSSFPVHPPEQPEQLHDRLLSTISLPMLFFRGTMDPFSTNDAWQRLRSGLVSLDVEVCDVAGADHGLRIRGDTKGEAPVEYQITTALGQFLRDRVINAPPIPREKPKPKPAKPAAKGNERSAPKAAGADVTDGDAAAEEEKEEEEEEEDKAGGKDGEVTDGDAAVEEKDGDDEGGDKEEEADGGDGDGKDGSGDEDTRGAAAGIGQAKKKAGGALGRKGKGMRLQGYRRRLSAAVSWWQSWWQT